MKYTLFAALLLSTGALQAQTNNVGINTSSPGSRLTVNGSVGMPYRSVTASYTMTADDYYVSYAGSSAGTITLPAAISGNGNFGGRIYRIRNASAQLLSVSANGAELISGNGQIRIPAGSIAELVSSGATSGSSWQVMTASTNTFTTDGIRGALNAAGCASCAAYDATAVNSWVAVTAAEYNAVANTVNLPGVAKYGSTDAEVATPAGYHWGAGVTVGSAPGWASVAGLYLVAFKTNLSTTSTGIALKVGSSPSTGYTGYGSPVNSATAGLLYFVIKRPGATTGTLGNIGIFNGTSTMGLTSGASPMSYDLGNVSNLTGSSSGAATVQVVGTAIRQW